MGAIQRGTSWATIPKTLNRARTVHAPCAHRARTVRQRPLNVLKGRPRDEHGDAQPIQEVVDLEVEIKVSLELLD